MSVFSVTVRTRTCTYTRAQYIYMSNVAAVNEILKSVIVLKYLTN